MTYVVNSRLALNKFNLMNGIQKILNRITIEFKHQYVDTYFEFNTSY